MAFICAVEGFGPALSRLPPLVGSSFEDAFVVFFAPPFPLDDVVGPCLPFPVAGAVVCFPLPDSGFEGSAF